MIPLRHRPPSTSVHEPPRPWDPLQSPAESVRKAKVVPKGRATRGNKKPTDLLGKEIRACRDGGAVVARGREHFTQYDFFDGAARSLERCKAGGNNGHRCQQ